MRSNAKPASGVYECEIISDPARFLALKPEWDALFHTRRDSYLNETFDWARLCWELVSTGRKRTLCCLTARSAGRLAGVWPLTVAREKVWRVATPLTSGSEYCPYLVHPDADVDEIWKAMRRTLAAAGVDSARLLNVRQDTPLGRCLARQLPEGCELYGTKTMYIRSDDLTDWASYRARLSPKARGNANNFRRRFEKAAKVTFEEVTDPAERTATWEWMLKVKRAWAERRGLKNKWLFSDQFERFIAATLDHPWGSHGERRIFALKGNGRIAAAELVSVDGTRVEAFMSSFDEEFSAFSPGNLLHEDVIRWAGGRGLGYDMRLGAGQQKEAWSTRSCMTFTYIVPLTPNGKLFSACLRLAANSGKDEEADTPAMQPPKPAAGEQPSAATAGKAG